MIVPLFKEIENKNMPKMVYEEYPWGSEQLKRKIYVVPAADTRNIALYFPVPNVIPHYKTAVKYLYPLESSLLVDTH